MRHIPEAELHAYLDQALSRPQCVEIESHLADCSACHAARDDIAALRDQTTALLARLAPPASAAPSFDVLRYRSAAKASARRSGMQRWAWAASVLGSIGLGWAAADLFRGQQADAPPAAPVAATADSAAAPSRSDTPVPTVAQTAARDSGTPATSKAPPKVTAPRMIARQAPVSALSQPVPAVGPASEWETVSWDGAHAEAGGQTPPHIDGLPVVEVQVQKQKKSEAGQRPMMVVAQQLATGEVIRTIEGPANDVSRLLGRRVMTDPVPVARSDSARVDRTMTLQQDGRMLAITGAVPSDSLSAMMHRVNTELGRSDQAVPLPILPHHPHKPAGQK